MDDKRIVEGLTTIVYEIERAELHRSVNRVSCVDEGAWLIKYSNSGTGNPYQHGRWLLFSYLVAAQDALKGMANVAAGPFPTNWAISALARTCFESCAHVWHLTKALRSGDLAQEAVIQLIWIETEQRKLLDGFVDPDDPDKEQDPAHLDRERLGEEQKTLSDMAEEEGWQIFGSKGGVRGVSISDRCEALAETWQQYPRVPYADLSRSAHGNIYAAPKELRNGSLVIGVGTHHEIRCSILTAVLAMRSSLTAVAHACGGRLDTDSFEALAQDLKDYILDSADDGNY